MKLVWLLINGLFLTGCFFSEGPKAPVEIRGEVFGSYYLVKYVGALDQDKFRQDLARFFKSFNDEFSTYQQDSLVSRFNRSRANEKIKATPRFIEMLKTANRLFEETKGAFDPTLGPVIKLWGFGGGVKGERPSDAKLKEAMDQVGIKHISWNEKTYEVWKTKDRLELDLNAFAPGLAADLIGKMLEDEKVMNYMVDLSGEFAIRGEKSLGNKWVIGIEIPSEQYAQGVQVAFKIQDLAVATSGDYRQFFNEKGYRRSHIIDPRTGKSVIHNVSSATVITDSCVRADAWSTAMMVLGEEGIPLAEENEVKVYLLENRGPQEWKSIISPSMESYLKGNYSSP